MSGDESFMTPPMKVCPFCGSAKLKIQTVWNEYRYVCCKNCRAAGPVVKVKNHPSAAAVDVSKTDEEAVERWNHSSYREMEYAQMQTNPRDIVPDLDELEIFINDILDNLNSIQLDKYSSWPQLTTDEVRSVFRKVDNAQGAACECGRIVKEMRIKEAERGDNDFT